MRRPAHAATWHSGAPTPSIRGLQAQLAIFMPMLHPLRAHAAWILHAGVPFLVAGGGLDNCTSDASAIHYRGFAIGIGTGRLQLPASAFSGIPNLMTCAPNGSPAPLQYGPYWPSWGFVYNTNLGPLPAGA
jgi:hypothetical protein